MHRFVAAPILIVTIAGCSSSDDEPERTSSPQPTPVAKTSQVPVERGSAEPQDHAQKDELSQQTPVVTATAPEDATAKTEPPRPVNPLAEFFRGVDRSIKLGPEEEPARSPGPKVGDVAPDIIGVDIEGVEFRLSEYRGKVVVLDFWGDW